MNLNVRAALELPRTLGFIPCLRTQCNGQLIVQDLSLATKAVQVISPVGKAEGKKSNSRWLAWRGVNVMLKFASISSHYSVWKPSETSSNWEVHHQEAQSKPIVSFVRTPSFPQGQVYGLSNELRRSLLLMENADLSQRKTA